MYNFSKLTNRKETDSLKWDVAKHELPMWVADMDFETAPEIVEAIEKRVSHKIFGYNIVPDEYFQSIQYWWQTRHQYNMEKEWMMFCTGVVPAISSIVRKLTTVGENVLIQSPVYNIFYNSILNNGRCVLSSDLVYDGYEYNIDFDDLEKKAADPKVKLLLLCNPHNPVGRAWTREELKKIADLCLRYQVTILSDDVYCGLTYAGKPYTPIASLSQEISYHTITFYSTSKTYNTTALRHAFMVSENPELTKRYSELLTSMGVSYGQNLMGLEATIAAFRECEPWRIRLMEQIAANHRFLKAAFEKNMPECKVLQAEATYFAWIDLRALDIRPAQLTYLLEQETQIVVENGFRLGKGGAGFIRFNLATSQENLQEGTKRLIAFCKRHCKH